MSLVVVFLYFLPIYFGFHSMNLWGQRDSNSHFHPFTVLRIKSPCRYTPICGRKSNHHFQPYWTLLFVLPSGDPLLYLTISIYQVSFALSTFQESLGVRGVEPLAPSHGRLSAIAYTAQGSRKSVVSAAAPLLPSALEIASLASTILYSPTFCS